MTLEFKHKTVLVTGATTGIGRETTLAFARLGAKVWANYYEHDAYLESLEAIVREEQLSVETVQADVRSAISVTEMFRKITSVDNSLDILINNAGISMIKPFLDISESEWDTVIDTDLKSVFLCSQAAIKLMLGNPNGPSGVIINIASELGFSGRANFSAYTAAKGGIITLTRSLAKEFAPAVRINGVAPGPTITPLLEKELAMPGHEEDLKDIPLARYANPEEIAESILFLASSKARYYCGAFLNPNGGTVI